MIYGIFVVARVDTSDVAGHRLEHGRSRRPHQSLWSWDQARKEDPSRESRDLSIGENGTLAQDGKETDDIKLQLL